MTLRIIVVGADIVGLCTAWAAARAGHAVALVPSGDEEPVPERPLLQLPSGDALGLVALKLQACTAWSRVWSDLGASHFRHTGGLVLEGAGRTWAEQSRRGLDAADVPVVDLWPHQLQERWPGLPTRDCERAFHVERGGLLLSGPICRDLLAWVGERARVAESAAERIEPGRAVLLDGTELVADELVVTSGTERWLPELGRARSSVARVRPPTPSLGTWRCAPVLLDRSRREGTLLELSWVPAIEAGLVEVRLEEGGGSALEPLVGRHPGYAVEEVLQESFPAFQHERVVADCLEGLWVVAGGGAERFALAAALGLGLVAALDDVFAAPAFTDWAAGWPTDFDPLAGGLLR